LAPAEHQVLVVGEPISSALVDFALFFFRNSEELMARQRPLLLPAKD
jgi:hypothetical protein